MNKLMTLVKARRKSLITALAVLTVIAVGLGGFFAFYFFPRVSGLNSSDASAWVKGVALPPSMEEQDDVFQAVSSKAPMPSPEALAATLDPMVDSPLFDRFTGSVVDALSGRTLWEHHPSTALQSASVLKLLTAQAAILVLPSHQRVKTQTLLGSNGTIILKGFGDVTLSQAPNGSDTFYRDAARISDLAARTATVLKKKGIHPTRIIVDTSLYQGSVMAEGWNNPDISGGFIAPMSPTMLDGGRLNYQEEESPRATSPATHVAMALARELGISSVSITTTPTIARTVLATTWSAPLITRLHDVLIHSDNVLAEAVGREIALQEGEPATFDGATRAIRRILRNHKINTDGLRMVDASGLSLDNRVNSRTLVQVLRLSTSTTNSRSLLDDLPVSGGSGTLSYRFDGTNGSARGWVRAKTGTLSGASSLAGIVVTREGRVLVFAFIMNGVDPTTARPAIDALAATLYTCGCRNA